MTAPVRSGLTTEEAAIRLTATGLNALPETKSASILTIFTRQFLSPLIYILAIAAAISGAMGSAADALFISCVLLVNGVVGTVQEFSANRATQKLRQLEQPMATVIRDNRRTLVDAHGLVPGDLVMLEAGGRVPADIVLLESADLRCDESLLTGESRPVTKRARNAGTALDAADVVVLAGTLVTRGRGLGIVQATGMSTRLGAIHRELARAPDSEAPLVIRLQRFSRGIALAIGAAVLLLALIGVMRGMPARDLFMMSVGLAVAAIPEGLPVAVSVALAIGMHRMARHHVIVRRLAAVEALGSCTMIATDKTGTLTMNELTVTDIWLPDATTYACEVGKDIERYGIRSEQVPRPEIPARVAGLLRAAVLANEAVLCRDTLGWQGVGDTVDIALLEAAIKARIDHSALARRYPLVARIPYEPEQRYAASFHRDGDIVRVFVKGAPETLMRMCHHAAGTDVTAPSWSEAMLAQKALLAHEGLRVLAFAEGIVPLVVGGHYGRDQISGLTFLGLVGMQDPLRPEVPQAVLDCYRAGVEVALITGDDAGTAQATARRAGIQFGPDQVATGSDLHEAVAQGTLTQFTRRARIFARMAPEDKVAIATSMARDGHFVAMTGDGVNDAPALRHSHVGVAMGRNGTDIARESADIVITDDNFASIVSGIREGRVVYGNIRKVIFMQVSTGAAELLLFLFALPLGLPVPLLPSQLLWLNLVTNGIQDVALAAERAEGDELSRPPRRPAEPIFDRLLMRRLLTSALVMALVGTGTLQWMLARGYEVDAARNVVLLLFVLFENLQTFNSRSERHSVFRPRTSPNPLLVAGIAATLALHVGAMYLPGLAAMLHIAPVSIATWLTLVPLAFLLTLIVELDKWQRRILPRLWRTQSTRASRPADD